MEEWRPIRGFGGRYEISDLGRLRNAEGRILRPGTNGKKGYRQAHLYRDGERVARLVHRLVAAAFLPNPHRRPHVAHLDHDVLNCRASNLMWATASQNMRQSKDAGRLRYVEYPVIGRAPNGEVVRFRSQCAAERYFSGRNSSAVHHCLIGKKKTAYGFSWSRA